MKAAKEQFRDVIGNEDQEASTAPCAPVDRDRSRQVFKLVDNVEVDGTRDAWDSFFKAPFHLGAVRVGILQPTRYFSLLDLRKQDLMVAGNQFPRADVAFNILM